MVHRKPPYAVLSTAAMLALFTGCSALPRDPIPSHEILDLQSKVLGEQRRIAIYTPIAYALEPTARFPVLYMPDGGIGEDFPHIVATIEELIATGTIPPMLVVGIENTDRKRDLAGPTIVADDLKVAPSAGGSAKFREFIQRELIPEIEQRYRCNARRAIVGESLAGLFVVETMLLQPKLFDQYIAISPSLWWNNHGLVRSAQSLIVNSIGHPMRVFLSHGNETDIVPYAAELAQTLKEHAPSSLQLVFAPHPEEQHHTVFRAVKHEAFRAVLRR
jgi:uncharacterized protein